MDLVLKEVEVNRINLQPGETLVIKMTGEEFDEANMKSFGDMFRNAFPNNRIVVLGMPDGHVIEFEAINKTVANKSESSYDDGCDSDRGYCSDCSCGKREQIIHKKMWGSERE